MSIPSTPIPERNHDSTVQICPEKMPREEYSRADHRRALLSPFAVVVGIAFTLGALAGLLMGLAAGSPSWQFYSWDASFLEKFDDNETHVSYAVNDSTYPDDTLVSYFVVPHSTDIPSDTYYTVYNKTHPGHTNHSVSQSWVKDTNMYGMFAGIWDVCDELSDSARMSMGDKDRACFSYVREFDEETSDKHEEGKWIARLHNSAASCLIVSLIDTLAGLIVGIIGIAWKQVSMCMVTGALHGLAALFGLFSLAIFHTKDHNERYECYSFYKLPAVLCDAQIITLGWSLGIAWFSVFVSVFTCLVWLFITRAIRVIKGKCML